MYSGEQFDSKIGQQYLRQRYYDPATGRFNRLDQFFGNLNDPQSLHKYLYAHADSINGIDPSGKSLASVSISVAIGVGIAGIGAGTAVLGNGLYNWSYGNSFFHNWETAALMGGGFALAAAYFPFLGIVLAGIGLGFSFNTWCDVVFDSSTTTRQKIAATSLVLFSAFGAYVAASYGASASSGASPKNLFWFNPKALNSHSFSSFKALLVKQYEVATTLRTAVSKFPQVFSRSKTIAVGLLRNPKTGEFFQAAMSNEGNGYVRPQVREALPNEIQYPRLKPNEIPSDHVWQNNPHAEVRLFYWAKKNGFELYVVSASRAQCSQCRAFLAQQGIGTMHPLETPYIFPVVYPYELPEE